MEYYIVHSGVSKRDGAKVGSGRYRLGSGLRPFQRMKEKKAEREKEKWETEKARVLRDGTSREILAVADRLTTQELQSAYNRLQAKQNIRNVNDSMFDRVDRAMNKLNKVNNWVNTVDNTSKWVNKFLGKETNKNKQQNFATKQDIDSLKKSIDQTLREAASNVDKKEAKKLNKEAKQDKKTWDKIFDKFEQSHPNETFETWNVKPDEIIHEPITDYSRLLETYSKKKRKKK